MNKTMRMNYCNGGTVYVINDETDECDNIYTFDFLENIEIYCPDFRTIPDLYNAWLYYRDIMNKPLPPLVNGHE